MNPKNWKAYSYRAIVKLEPGDLKGACSDWRLALDLGDQDSVQ